MVFTHANDFGGESEELMLGQKLLDLRIESFDHRHPFRELFWGFLSLLALAVGALLHLLQGFFQSQKVFLPVSGYEDSASLVARAAAARVRRFDTAPDAR